MQFWRALKLAEILTQGSHILMTLCPDRRQRFGPGGPQGRKEGRPAKFAGRSQFVCLPKKHRGLPSKVRQGHYFYQSTPRLQISKLNPRVDWIEHDDFPHA